MFSCLRVVHLNRILEGLILLPGCRLHQELIPAMTFQCHKYTGILPVAGLWLVSRLPYLRVGI